MIKIFDRLISQNIYFNKENIEYLRQFMGKYYIYKLKIKGYQNEIEISKEDFERILKELKGVDKE